jgi:hypothetical protein
VLLSSKFEIAEVVAAAVTVVGDGDGVVYEVVEEGCGGR